MPACAGMTVMNPSKSCGLSTGLPHRAVSTRTTRRCFASDPDPARVFLPAASWFPLWWGADSGRHLCDKRQELFERGEACSLARHHVFNPPRATPLPDLGLCPKLHDKGPVRGQGGRGFCRRLHAFSFSSARRAFALQLSWLHARIIASLKGGSPQKRLRFLSELLGGKCRQDKYFASIRFASTRRMPDCGVAGS